MTRLLTDEVAALLGKEVVYEAPDEIGRASIRYFATAIGSDNPVYTDPEFARLHGFPDVIAPPTFVCETNQFIAIPPDADGYAGHSWDIDIPGTRLLRGGNEYELLRPVGPDDRITVRWRIADASERTSADGRSLLILLSEAVYADSTGEIVAKNRETLVFQEV
jgi:acyl dehydratase